MCEQPGAKEAGEHAPCLWLVAGCELLTIKGARRRDMACRGSRAMCYAKNVM